MQARRSCLPPTQRYLITAVAATAARVSSQPPMTVPASQR